MIKTRIFHHGEGDSVCYCSPGMVIAADGSALVFCEARLGSGKDDAPHHLVYKRSTDGGQTWGHLRFLEESRGQCYMNPVPVTERESGRIFLCYGLADGGKSTRVFMRESADCGVSWSPPAELTSLFAADTKKRSYHLPGPGHGIQMKNGRLIIPFWHRKPLKILNADGEAESIPPAKRDYSVNVIYSDEAGRVWHPGGYLDSNAPDGFAYCMNEANVTESAEGLVLLARTYDRPELPYRYRCVSADGGEEFSSPREAGGLSKGVQCYTGLTSDGQGLYILARPDLPDNPRRGLTLYLSNDTDFWRRGVTIEQDFSAYSDLALTPDGRIMAVYISTMFNDAYGKTIDCVLLEKDELQ